MGGGDERAIAARACEDDVARLVTDEQGPNDPGRRRRRHVRSR
jgi:hypothetical protein